MDSSDIQLLREQVDAILAELPEKQKEAIKWRFGLNDAHPRTVPETAHLMNVSEDEVKALEFEALSSMRSHKMEEVPHFTFNVDSPAARRLRQAIFGADIPE